MGDKELLTIHPTTKYVWCVIAVASLLSGCVTLAARDTAAPASHHAQRKYDEAAKKGATVPAEKRKNDRK